MTIQHLIAQRLNLRDKQVEATLKLLDEGATIPFISRYRKEATGALDEVQVAAVADEYRKAKNSSIARLLCSKPSKRKVNSPMSCASASHNRGMPPRWKTSISPSNPSVARRRRWRANEDWNLSLRSCCSVRKTIQS